MIRIQLQFPDPLYRRLKEIAQQQDWSLSEVMRKAAEHFVERFPESADSRGNWAFPTLDCGGDFLVDPALSNPEADAIVQRDRAASRCARAQSRSDGARNRNRNLP